MGVAHRPGRVEVEADVVDERAQKFPGGGEVKASLEDERGCAPYGEGSKGTQASLEASSACVDPEKAYGESQGSRTYLIAKPRAESDTKAADQDVSVGVLSAEGQTQN